MIYASDFRLHFLQCSTNLSRTYPWLLKHLWQMGKYPISIKWSDSNTISQLGVNAINKFNSRIAALKWSTVDFNCGPLESEATALPTELPQPLPWKMFFCCPRWWRSWRWSRSWHCRGEWLLGHLGTVGNEAILQTWYLQFKSPSGISLGMILLCFEMPKKVGNGALIGCCKSCDHF